MLILKPFQTETHVYYTTLSREDFIRKLQRATAPKPDLISDSIFTGHFPKGTTSFRLMDKTQVHSGWQKNGEPPSISGTFYEEGDGRIRVEITVVPRSIFTAFAIVFPFITFLLTSVIFSIVRSWETCMFYALVPFFIGLYMFLSWFGKDSILRSFVSEFSLRHP